MSFFASSCLLHAYLVMIKFFVILSLWRTLIYNFKSEKTQIQYCISHHLGYGGLCLSSASAQSSLSIHGISLGYWEILECFALESKKQWGRPQSHMSNSSDQVLTFTGLLCRCWDGHLSQQTKTFYCNSLVKGEQMPRHGLCKAEHQQPLRLMTKQKPAWKPKVTQASNLKLPKHWVCKDSLQISKTSPSL